LRSLRANRAKNLVGRLIGPSIEDQERDSSPLVSKLVRRPSNERGRNEQAAVDFAAKEVTKEFHMANRRSYNFGDTFGDPVESDSIPGYVKETGPWCNQPDGIFEEDDRVREQGGAA
jgi:hypothetical protein